MKQDEQKFFVTCWRLRQGDTMIRDIISKVSDEIPAKRCLYLLGKWCRLGFYEYGVTLDLGWFRPSMLPSRYQALLTAKTQESESVPKCQ